MSDKPLTPCDGLDFEERAQRLAGYMRHCGQGTVKLRHAFMARRAVPGYCQVCGAKLAVVWRAIKCIELPSEQNPAGKTIVAEATHEPDSLAKLEAWKAANPVTEAELPHAPRVGDSGGGLAPLATQFEAGLRNGFWLNPVITCSSLDERTWNRATAIVLEKAQAVADGAKDDQKKGQRSERAKRAAAAAGSSGF